MINKIRKYYKNATDSAEAFIVQVGWTDKKIMEYCVYLFAIVLFIGAAGIFKFIGIYLPALIFFIRFCLLGSAYHFWKSPIFIGLALFAYSGLLSVFSSRHLWSSMIFFEKYHVRSLLIYFVVVTAFCNRKVFFKLVNIVALTSVIYLAWSFFEYGRELLRHGSIGRLDVLNAAWPLLYILPFTFMKFITARTRKVGFLWLLLGVLSVLSLILSGQRAAVLGVFVMLGIWFLYLRLKTRIVLVVCFLILVAAIVFIGRDLPIIQDYVVRGAGSDGRAQLLTAYLDMFRKNFWLGIGLDNDTMRDVYSETKKPELIHHQFMMAHNTYLTTATRQGVVGVTIFCLLLLSTVWALVRRLRPMKFDEQRALGIALLSCLVGMYVAYAAFTEIVLMPFALLLSMCAVFINNNPLKRVSVQP